jgi:hypothetical protein
VSQSQDPNEGLPVINYISGAMNRNASGADAAKIRSLNSFSATTCIEEWQHHGLLFQILTADLPRQCVDQEMTSRDAAILSWALLVRQGGPWDHKPYIRRTFHPRGPGEQVWHRLGPWEYYYDIWSNIHYGYVGRACGFSASTLLGGAGLEQIGSDLYRRRLPQRRPGVPGFASFDDASDQIAITMGTALFNSGSGGVSATHLRALVESAQGLDRRAAGPIGKAAHT